MPRSPLPPREGITASRLRAPADPPAGLSVADWLTASIPGAGPSDLADLEAGGSLTVVPVSSGRGPYLPEPQPAALTDTIVPDAFYWFHRRWPQEQRIPFETRPVYEDDHLLVVDKPHFLASTPNGRFVRECVLTRTRVERGEPDLVAVHRLDRVTAGLLMLSRRPETRAAYQGLFQDRAITKTYLALAAIREDRPAGTRLHRASRLEKEPGTRQVLEVPGEPNATTDLENLGAAAPGSDLWSLHPRTGKTHQLRVHMNALGMPIQGDPVYPDDLAPDPYDFSSPLRLLAARLEFIDPLDGRPRRFDSRLRLGAAPAGVPDPRGPGEATPRVEG